MINFSKTVSGKLNSLECVCVCTHVDTFMIIWLFFCFAVYLSGLLLLSICGDICKVIMTGREFLRACWSFSSLPGCMGKCLSAVEASRTQVADLDL